MRGEPVTVATDVFSLGVMLYELLAGRRPFARESGAGERDPEPPSAAARGAKGHGTSPSTSPTIIPPAPWHELGGDLDAITMKALRVEPESRYRSAAALADDLRHWLAGEPVEARRGGRRYRLGKFVRRHRVPVASATLAVLALIAGATIAVVQARASARERDPRDRGPAARRDHQRSVLIPALGGGAGAGKPTSKGDLLARGEAVVDQRLADDPPLRVHMLLTLAERYYENYQYEDWKRTVGRAYDLSRPLADRRLRALAGCVLANVEGEVGDRERVAR
jgi:serine/threonine-protein kinase